MASTKPRGTFSNISTSEEDIETSKASSYAFEKSKQSHVEWALPSLDVKSIQSRLTAHEHFEVE